MKNSIPVWGILLAIWIIGGAFIYQSFCCGPLGSGFTIMDGNTTVARSNQNLVFGFSGAKPEVPDAAKSALEKAVVYLKDHPGKVLFLNGAYLDSENQPNLGMARAESVETYLQELGLPAGMVLMNGNMSNELLVDNDKVYNTIDFDIGDIPHYSLIVEDGEQFSEMSPTNLVFEHSGFEYQTPVSESVNQVFERVKKYLDENPKKTLKITGFHHQSEENTSMLTSLGLARANQIKNILQDMGIAGNRIDTDAEELEDLIFPGEQLYGGATYSFNLLPDAYSNEEKIASVEKELKIESINLYFETDASSLNLDNEQRRYFGKLVEYLDNKPSARVNVVGHTDNKGTNSYNLKLSQERANFIKSYLVKNGLDGDQIVVVGKGERSPIETNTTESGRAKNRRVEVYLK